MAATKRNLDMYEEWRNRVKDALDYFVASLPVEQSNKLDYSPGSLDIVEEWLLQRYEIPLAVRDETDEQLLDGAIFYIGETYRICLGGYWNVHFANLEPSYEYGESAVIEGFDERNESSAICPSWRAFDAIRDRFGCGLSQNLRALMEFVNEPQ